MANIELVIKIPEEVYKSIQDNDYCGISNADMYNAMKNGTPLPKGHGRLIDADMLPICHGVFLPRVNGNALGCPEDAVFVSDIEDAPTIIEAESKGNKND